MKQITLFCLLSLSYFNLFTQPNIEWERSIGGSMNESIQDILMTNDGGFIVLGSTASSDVHVSREENEGDLWLVKLDSMGLIDWENNFNNSGVEVLQTEDKGYLILGNIEMGLGDESGIDFWLLKVDSLGEHEWDISLGGQRNDIASDLIQMSDDSYALIGRTHSFEEFENFHGLPGSSDIGVIKVDLEGNTIWQKAYGGDGKDYGTAIQQLPPLSNEVHGNLILYGDSDSDNDGGDIEGDTQNFDFIIMEIDDTTGVREDGNTDVISGGCTDKASDLALTNDHSRIGGGSTLHIDVNYSCTTTIANSFPGELDCTLFKIGTSPQWYRVLGGTGDERATSVIHNQNEKLLLSAYSNSDDDYIWEFVSQSDYNYFNIGTGTNKGNYDYWVVQFNLQGEFEWSLKLGGSDYDVASDIIEVDNKEYLVAGISESSDMDVSQNLGDQDIWLVKLGENCPPAQRPEKPLLIGETLFCNKDQIEINAQAYDGNSIEYLWETPLGVIKTDEPSLILNDISEEEHTGLYTLLVKEDGCLSPFSDPMKISVYREDAIIVTPDFSTCLEEERVSANFPLSSYVSSRWYTDNIAQFLDGTDSSTFVRNLQPGVNDLIWSFSAPGCPDFESDTLKLLYKKPVAIDDITSLDVRSSSVEIPVLLNDELNGIVPSEVEITQPPNIGEATVTGGEDILYDGAVLTGGVIQFTYQVCSDECPDLCSQADVIITRTSFNVPEGITPNNDGKNDVLIIDGLNEAYPNNHMYIYNRWGDEVFNARPYNNNWDGTHDNNPLPEGVYYYLIDLAPGAKPIKGSIHLFR